MTTAKEVALDYLRKLSQTFRGEGAPYVELLHEDIKMNLLGKTPISGSVNGLAELIALGQAVGAYFKLDPEFDIFPERVIEQGDRVAVVAHGRGEAASGRPYNNCYLFFFTIRDGRISDLHEICDTALINWALFNKDYVNSRS